MTGTPPLPVQDEYDEAEAARRRDEVIARMLATPPQPKLKRKPKAESQSKPTDG